MSYNKSDLFIYTCAVQIYIQQNKGLKMSTYTQFKTRVDVEINTLCV